MADIAKLTGKAFDVVNLASVPVFVGALLGAMLVFLFASFAIRAVSKTAQSVIDAVRIQFKDPAIMAGTKKPDYAAVIDITTQGALRNMVLPGILVIDFPIIIGVTMKYEALAGFLMVATITGILLALILNNSGGAWDNAKKYIDPVPMAARRAKPTRQRSSGIRSATRSRTQQARHSTCSSSSLPR